MSLILGILDSGGAAAGAGGSYESIATVNVGGGGSASVDFTSIPATYKHLQIRAIYSNTNTGNTREVTMKFNSDSSTNYSWHNLAGNGTSVISDAGSSTNFIYVGQSYSGGAAGASAFGASIIDILDYTDTNKYKTSRALWGWDTNGQGTSRFNSGLWRNTNAITTITLEPNPSGNFAQYTQFALYGIKGA
jgi:hypothetical protein